MILKTTYLFGMLAAVGFAPAADGREPLTGEWLLEEAVRDGRPDASLRGHLLRFQGDRFEIRAADGSVLFAGAFEADPTANPATIDFEHDHGALQGVKWLGIFEHDPTNKSLRIADNAADPDQPRPSSFRSQAGDGVVLLRFERPEQIVLFDGRSLDGWELADFFGAGPVDVEEGAIRLEAGDALSAMTGITTTRDDLPHINYEMTYQAQRLDGRDFFAAATFPVGEDYLTFVNGGWGGTVTGLSSIDGFDASENQTGTLFRFENGRWYTFRIRVTDRRVRCWVATEEVVDFEHVGHDLGTRVEVRVNEPLGFATWESSGALRNITLRPLADLERAAVEAKERQTGPSR